jgi:uncharacterized protein YdhG (YjbR/CyaY superfamily)
VGGTVARGRADRLKSGTSSPATVDAYLRAVSPEFRPLLRDLRKTIRAAAPRATESVSYGIPTLKQDGHRLIYFSAAANHCAIHMVRKAHLDEAVRVGFRIGRGSIRFTPEHPLPKRLVTKIVKARLAQIRSARQRAARS